MKLSIIISAYNCEHTISRCITALTRHSLPAFEILIINDASTDATATLCRTFVRLDSRLKVIDTPKNLGVANARNIGIQNAEGEYITFVDSDDYVTNGFLKFFTEASQKHPGVDIIIGNVKSFNAKSGLPIYDKYFERDPYQACPEIFTHEDILPNKFYAQAFTVFAKFYRRNFIKINKIELPNLRCFEDNVFTHHCLLLAKSIYRSDFYIYNYFRQHRHSLTASKKSAQDLLTCNKMMYNHVSSLAPALTQAFKAYQQRSTLYWLKKETLSGHLKCSIQLGYALSKNISTYFNRQLIDIILKEISGKINTIKYHFFSFRQGRFPNEHFSISIGHLDIIAPLKCASSTFRNIEMHIYQGLNQLNQFYKTNNIHQPAHPTLIHLKRKAWRHRLHNPNSKKILIVRNPYARVISIYKDKVFAQRPWSMERETIRSAILKGLLQSGRMQNRSHSCPEITFEDFIFFICFDKSFIDSHWKSIFTLSRPDRYNYHIILKMEELSTTGTKVLSTLLPEHRDVFKNFLQNKLNRTDNMSLNDGLNAQLAELIYQNYQQDFETFGYEKDSWKIYCKQQGVQAIESLSSC